MMVEQVVTYVAEIIPQNRDDISNVVEIMRMHREGFNIASEIQFGLKKKSVVTLHNKCYSKIRKTTGCPAQVAIRAHRECLSAYRSVSTNKYNLKSPIVKKNLSISLDKRLYRRKDHTFYITTANGRKPFNLNLYPKIRELFEKYNHGDPTMFEREGKIFLSIPFKIPVEPVKPKLALGVDLGMRINAACSDGRLINDKNFNGRKRKLRFLKRKLQSRKTRSAKRHLKKLRRKEHNINRNHINHLANKILETDANIIVLEDLKGLKVKKHRYQNKRAISQVPFFALKQALIYKAFLLSKRVILVNPAYTSQTDSVTGKRDGIRKGRRYISKNGLIYDADINAAINIAKKSKLPVSQGNLLDGQGYVSSPYVRCVSDLQALVL